MALSAKQKLFISEYLTDFNATRAAQRAGYEGDENTLAVTGSRMLRNAKVDEAIRTRLSERAMSAEEVLSRLAEQARAGYSPYLQPNGTVDLEGLIRDGKAHLIKEIKITQWGTNVKFHDPHAAKELIGKHHRLFIDGPTGDENDPIHIKMDR